MLFESTSLASTVTVWLEAMDKHYGVDARPILQKHGIDLERLAIPGARYPDKALDRAAGELVALTGDPCLGLAVGRHVRPTSVHALGYAWLASDTLRDAFGRLARFDRTVSTGDHLHVRDTDEHTILNIASRVPGHRQLPAAIDTYFTGVLTFCQLSVDRNFCPVEVRLIHEDFGRAGDYVDAFQAPVVFLADADEIMFDREAVARPLPGRNAELAAVNDHVAEAYLESLDPDVVSSRVRELLVSMLPSGEATQHRIASKLARSTSALQRQLRSEGTSFQDLRDETRRDIALGHLRAGDMSLTEIAFLVGFTDQSNFSRAFRRWTGVSPREWKATQ